MSFEEAKVLGITILAVIGIGVELLKLVVRRRTPTA